MKSTNTHSLRASLLLTILLGLFAAGAAQPDAESFFHKGAQHYLATNETAQARQAVTNGLALYPDNLKLKKLWELLNQQQQQQSQSDQNQKDPKDQKDQKDQQSKDQQQSQDKEKQKQEQQKKDEEQGKQDDASKQKQDQGGEKKPDQAQQQQPGEQPEGDDGQAQQTRGARMTPQQAAQLLEAIKGEEKLMTFKPVLKSNRTDRVFKDW